MSTITLPVGSTLYFWDTAYRALSEHNRSSISIGTERIEQIQRMSNGTARKLYIADKINLSVSWSNLPSFSSFTVDGGWGALDIKNFYDSAYGKATFNVKVVHANSATLYTKDMYFSNCSIEMVRRNAKLTSSSTPQELWNVSIALEEV